MEVKKNVFEIHINMQLGHLLIPVNISSCHLRLGIMGHSGSGKSSFAQAVSGINPSVSGEIVFQDKTYLKTGENIFIPAWERNFGYMPQDFLLMPHLTVEENILFPKKSQMSLEVLDGLQIRPLLQRMPRNLSGGEKQRVSIARALCSRSELLILDEPFASLDSKTKTASIEFIHHFAQQNSLPLLVISHGESELQALGCDVTSLD